MRVGKWALAAVLAGAAVGAQADDERWYAVSPKWGCVAYDSPNDFELEVLLTDGTTMDLVERSDNILTYHDQKYVDIKYVVIQGVSRCRKYMVDNEI